MAETMVTGFKRLPERAYLGGYTSCFGSRTHFQLATFYALTETPEIVRAASRATSFKSTNVALRVDLKVFFWKCGGGKLKVKIGFFRSGKSVPQIVGQKLGKSLRVPRIDLEIKRKSTTSDGNPDDFAETLRKSQIQFPEGRDYMGGGNHMDI